MTTLVTTRDLDVFQALARTPLTARQLLKVSETFTQPFTSERYVRERLGVLCAAGRVRRWIYSTSDRGALGYYVLSRLGYQLAHGPEVAVPHSIGKPVAVAQQSHTRALAEFIVHTVTVAHRGALPVVEFNPENSLRLHLGEESLYPDCAFTIAAQDRRFAFYVELDNGTQPIHSPRDFESWERKLRFYDRYRDESGQRFRVLIISTRSGTRLEHLLTTAARLVRLPERSLFYGVTLPAYLTASAPLTTLCFRDHRGANVALIPSVLVASSNLSRPAPSAIPDVVSSSPCR